MTEYAPARYWVVMKPSEQGAVVARFDTAGETPISQAIVDHDDFTVVSVPDRSSLTDKELDRSVLTEKEQEILGVDV